MNKYEVFFNDLKSYLIENNLQNKDDFKECSIEKINSIATELPLAYIEWLKVFGNTSYLLNYPIEEYTLEEFEYAQEEIGEVLKNYELDNGLILISIFQDLHTFIKRNEENPSTFQLNIGNQIFPEELRNQKKFTTHIKNLIIHLINNQNELNEWFVENITDFDKKPHEKKQGYIDLMNEIEELEEKENRIYKISEIIKLWNNKKTAYNNV